ncbi:MAG: SbcC/MukB-like Walker B domain-containing protein, partial [Acidimicrobiia bacterium]
AAVDVDAAALPDGRPLLDQTRVVETAQALLLDAEERLAASRRLLAIAEESVRSALRSLTTLGARHQLPTTAAGLEEITTALGGLERAVATWARRRREQQAAERVHRDTGQALERAQSHAAEAAEHHGASLQDSAEVDVRLETLESTIGADYRAVLERLAALEEERRSARARNLHLGKLLPDLLERKGGLEANRAQAASDRAKADDWRASCHRRFIAAAADGFATESGVTLSGSPPEAATADQPDRADDLVPDDPGLITAPLEGITAVLAAARAVATQLPDVEHDDQALERASARVQERLHHVTAALGGRFDVARELSDQGWWQLRAGAGVRRSAADLAGALKAELDTGRAELAVEEEELFEQTLAGSVRQALAQRIRQANHLLDGINRQLDTVRTAAGGVRVRLRWDVDPDQPAAVKAARSLLLRDPASLSDSERSSLQTFVRTRVDQARAELEASAPWEARLRETLDYRAWHRFTLTLAHRDWEGFEPATPRRLHRLSTGERSIALHLPMLASIAAHYSDETGQASGAPRLILLDELFAGVDTANRSQLFGTFTDWDLDAVFTSDHEWCQYASLDGIAIHHLHPAVGEGPVTSTRFTWDGRQRTLDPPAA